MSSKSYPGQAAAARAIVEIGRRMYSRGFVAANDGNISCRLRGGQILITPTGVSKGFMRPEMLVLLSADGTPVTGGAATSELKMHLRVYQENPRLRAVVHAHPPISTAYAACGRALDAPILTEALMLLGPIPLVPYAAPGSDALPEAIAPYVQGHHGALLANHGALAWGRDLFEAWSRLESIEHYARITLYSGLLGGGVPIPDDEQERLRRMRKKNA